MSEHKPLIVDYPSFYDTAYWTGNKVYRAGDGTDHNYIGPALVWHGFRFIADALAPLVPGKTLLDIGCSAGDLASQFFNHGFSPYGVDISEFAVQRAVDPMKGRLALADITTCPKDLWAYVGPNEDRGKGEGYDWPFPEKYDVVMATDLLEHLYASDLDATFDWIVKKAKRWIFFCVATAGSPDKGEFIHTKGEQVPIEWEGTAISGHVNVRHWTYWVDYFEKKKLPVRWDLGYQLQLAREMCSPWRDTMGWNLQTTWVLDKLWNSTPSYVR